MLMDTLTSNMSETLVNNKPPNQLSPLQLKAFTTLTDKLETLKDDFKKALLQIDTNGDSMDADKYNAGVSNTIRYLNGEIKEITNQIQSLNQVLIKHIMTDEEEVNFSNKKVITKEAFDKGLSENTTDNERIKFLNDNISQTAHARFLENNITKNDHETYMKNDHDKDMVQQTTLINLESLLNELLLTAISDIDRTSSKINSLMSKYTIPPKP